MWSSPAGATRRELLRGRWSRPLGERIDRGAVVTDTPAETDVIDVLLGDHPVPTERSVESTRAMLNVARSATADDLMLAIVTGPTGTNVNDLRAFVVPDR